MRILFAYALRVLKFRSNSLATLWLGPSRVCGGGVGTCRASPTSLLFELPLCCSRVISLRYASFSFMSCGLESLAYGTMHTCRTPSSKLLALCVSLVARLSTRLLFQAPAPDPKERHPSFAAFPDNQVFQTLCDELPWEVGEWA